MVQYIKGAQSEACKVKLARQLSLISPPVQQIKHILHSPNIGVHPANASHLIKAQNQVCIFTTLHKYTYIVSPFEKSHDPQW